MCCLLLLLATNAFAEIRPVNLRCENLASPLGIDAVRPRLSWTLESRERDQRQTAYQILVASSEAVLRRNQGDLWDSGRVASDQSFNVIYAGSNLSSHAKCFWKVRVWDQDNHASWSPVASWSMGILESNLWNAVWIGLDGREDTNWLSGTDWIWFPEGEPQVSAPVESRYFRRTFSVPRQREIRRATLIISGDNEVRAFVNGREAGSHNDYRTARVFDITSRIEPGVNAIALSGSNQGQSPNPAAVTALLTIEFNQGDPIIVATDEQWKTSHREEAGWAERDYDDSGWRAARKIGSVGMEPWKQVEMPGARVLPARWLRKEFTLDKRIRRATAYVSGLGLSELYINGSKIGDHVLSPALTEYNRRVFYVTHDVTEHLRRGPNAIGAVLGNGRYFAPRSMQSGNTRTFGFPKLLLQLRVEHTDGSVSTITSDETWKLTTNGPILANNEYDGEEYDASKELAGWDRPGFNDGGWQTTQRVSAPEGALVAQMMEPIRVTQTLRPVKMSEPKPGIFVFDLGQNIVGWCRLNVAGPAGTEVKLRHAESLQPDGTLYVANLRSARATDVYRLRGKGKETWEPRFTYHGFRYVEVTGFPGRPTLDAIEGRVVHDDLKRAGEFLCSNPLLNQIYSNVVWGTRGNYRSIPTDCPQRDERQGWLGDRGEVARGETFLFDTEAFHEKWLQDIADAQQPNGSIPDVAPSYWPIYSDDVTWPSTFVLLPHILYEQYGNRAAIERHFDSAVRWIDYMSGFVTNGLISKDQYGDWCVPPEDPVLIHSRDPARQTDRTLLATAYFYNDVKLMSSFAARLGRNDDACRFDALANTLNSAFNQRFLRKDPVQYDNGTQTSCVLPLAFGLVPDDARQAVFTRLTRGIADTQNHIGTGLVGAQFLNRVLSAHGKPDLAYAIVTQKTYPSLGYMVEKGATTVWELWNGDTADPSMNSGNHVMLIGDLVVWMYESLAGIQSDREKVGFKHIVMNPQPVADLAFVRASYESRYGRIVSDWRRSESEFEWRIEVPPNTTATIHIPAASLESVTENRLPVSRAGGIHQSRHAGDRAILEIGSGKYHFISKL